MESIIYPPNIYPILPKEINWAVAAEILAYLVCAGIAFLCAFLLEKHIAKRFGKKNKIINLMLPTAAAAVLILISGYTMESLKGFIFFLLLFYASVSDLAVREVDDSISLMIGLTALSGIGISDLPAMLLAALVITVPQFAVAVLKPGTYGGADVKIMAACAFLLGVAKGLLALVTGLILAVTVTLIVRKIRGENVKEPFALVPFLSAGCFLAYLI
ncbi:MAG: A24 family peptidase [Eubacteriales bacterium]|nr:A24 family peptidase [Eubacteriales bacterium]